MASDSLLFIDSANYLDLYRTDKGQSLLAPLAELTDHIFVTEQVAFEVQRNKLTVAANYLAENLASVELSKLSVPDHLFGSNESQSAEIRQSIKKASAEVKRINKEVRALTDSIFDKIVLGEDKVSETLRPIFSKALTHQPIELERARERKDRGNPPGKNTDVIGDELNWEQLLTHFKGKRRLWIVSRDMDYATVFKKRLFLNAHLLADLRKVTSDAEVFLFKSTVDGLTHFSQNSGVKAEKLPSPAEAKEIKKEEKQLRSKEELLWTANFPVIFENSYRELAERRLLKESAFQKMIREKAEQLLGRRSDVEKMFQERVQRDSAIEKAIRERAEELRARESAIQRSVRERAELFLPHESVAEKMIREGSERAKLTGEARFNDSASHLPPPPATTE